VLIFVRFAHFAATMLLFGASAFLWALAPAELASRLAGSVGRIVGAAIPVVGVTALLWLGLEAGLMGDGWSAVVNPDTLFGVLSDTAFGRVWQWRLCLVIVLIASVMARRHCRWAFSVPVSALLLASLGLVGHANLQSGLTGALHRANAGVHILAVGSWLGGLVPFILCLRLHGDPLLRKEVALTLRRFSGWGHFVVAIIVATGFANTALTLGLWPIDVSSPYRVLLIAKIAIVATMIAIAILNRYVLAPRLKFDATAVGALGNNVVGELILGGAALALVSVFGVLEPI
jgi:putative copper resistance protein D